MAGLGVWRGAGELRSLCCGKVPPEYTPSLAAASSLPGSLPKAGGGGGQVASLGRVQGSPQPPDAPPHPCSGRMMNRASVVPSMGLSPTRASQCSSPAQALPRGARDRASAGPVGPRQSDREVRVRRVPTAWPGLCSGLREAGLSGRQGGRVRRSPTPLPASLSS